MATLHANHRLNARLHHLAIQSADPAKLAGFYSLALGLRFERRQDSYLGSARDRCVLIEPGRNKALGFAAYQVEDPRQLTALRARLELVQWSTIANPTALFKDDAVCVRDPDGNTLVFGIPVADEESTPSGETLPARLQHFVIASRDCVRIAQFYEYVLGFTLSDRVLDTEKSVRTVFLRCGGEHHDFAVFQAAENGFDHHCYEAGEWSLIRDWADHMAASGIPIKWGPGRHGPGNNLFIFVHDVDGNWIEVSAELERVPADRAVGVWSHEERTLNLWGQAPLRS